MEKPKQLKNTRSSHEFSRVRHIGTSRVALRDLSYIAKCRVGLVEPADSVAEVSAAMMIAFWVA